MHPRRVLIADIKERLESASSPVIPVYEQEETAFEAPCYQIAFGQEEIDYSLSTRDRLCRTLPLLLTARGNTPTQRDGISWDAELALLTSPAPTGSKTIELLSVELETPEEGGRRNYPATHAFEIRYFTPRPA